MHLVMVLKFCVFSFGGASTDDTKQEHKDTKTVLQEQHVYMQHFGDPRNHELM